MDNVDNLTTGKYQVITEHGTYYLVDLDSKKFMRVRAQGRNPLNGDSEWIPFITVSEIIVGGRMHFVMFPSSASRGDTWRWTTLVTKIESIKTIEEWREE